MKPFTFEYTRFARTTQCSVPLISTGSVKLSSNGKRLL
jgi:hypothetical protein